MLLTGLKMRHLSCVLWMGAAMVLLSGAFVDCCNCSRSEETAAEHLSPATNQSWFSRILHAIKNRKKDAFCESESASQGQWQGDLSREREMELFQICNGNNVAGMKQYLRDGGSTYRIGGNGLGQWYPGYPLIVSAARNDSAEVVQCLIDAGADVNQTTLPGTDGGRDGKMNALHAAVECYGAETIRRLLRTRIDRNAKDEKGLTPLLCIFGAGRATVPAGLSSLETISAQLLALEADGICNGVSGPAG